MVSPTRALRMAALLLLASLVLSSFVHITHGAKEGKTRRHGTVVIYWGVMDGEGGLSDACKTGNYDIVIIAFIDSFGNGQPPTLDLAHCDASSGGCRGLSNDISHCQSMGVKVMVSLGGASGSYGPSSNGDAKSVAHSLWNMFLGGNSDNRPLGDAVLDGVDFDLESGSSDYYATLVRTLHNLFQDGDKQFYLGAAPQCPFPDEWDGPGGNTALATGLFDFVWVQFYNNDECQYHRHGDHYSDLYSSYDQWSNALPNSLIFLGLPASPTAADDSYNLDLGYIPSNVLVSNVLPHIRTYPNYGGVMLWCYYYDVNPSFSSEIESAL